MPKNITETDIKKALSKVKDLEGRPLAKSPCLQSISADDDGIIVLLEVDADKADKYEPVRQKCEKQLRNLGAESIKVMLTANKKAPEVSTASGGDKPKMARPPVHENLKPAGIKHIISVASGKGGVGKSTVAAHLALAMQQQGLKVGLMDADIYGPSIPKVFGLEGYKAQLNEDKKLTPPETKDGLKLMSIGFLVDPDVPMIWRGPMVQSAVRQFLQDVEWGELDTLVVDMPPGTGDIQLTMAQKVPQSGAIVVSTPQDIALIDARKAIEMFAKTNVPVLGLIENMSQYICSNCGHEDHIFGHGTLEKEAKTRGVPLLGTLPLSLDIRMNMDSGDITPNEHFQEIAKKVRVFLDEEVKVQKQ